MTMLLAPMLALAAAATSSIPIPLDPGRWIIHQENFKLDPEDRQLHNGEIGEFLGRRCMRLSKGLFQARDVEFRDGIIEADVAFSLNTVFFGLAFRIESADDY